MLRYKRQLSDDAFKILLSEFGNFIIPEIKSARPISEPYALDIQFRENDKLMVYYGTSCILIVDINTKKSTIKFSAAKAYFDGFLRTYNFGEISKGDISAYLKRIIPRVNPRYYSNKAEGYYQNILSFIHGEISNDKSPYVIFDRECVIGFSNTIEKNNLFDPIAEKFGNMRTNLQVSNPKKYGKPLSKKFGNELDFLAFDIELNLHCIELKHGSNTSGIYWGPLQIAVYKELFNHCGLSSLFEDIKILVSQKADLNLLPKETKSFFQNKNCFNSIISHLLIGKPNYKSSCWDTMKEVINENANELSCKISITEKDGLIKDL